MTNQELAGRARLIARQSGRGVTRKAALCLAVALGTTSSVTAARSALDSDVLPADIRSAAVELLGRLGEENGQV